MDILQAVQIVFGSVIFRSTIIIAAAYIFAQLINRVIRRGAIYARLSPEATHSVTRGITAISLLIGLFGVLAHVGVTSLLTLATGLGIVSIVISFALQPTLSNMIAGISLLIDRTIRLHDLIEISGIKGHVIKIGIRTTWIKTEKNELVIVSNSTLMNTPLKNHSLSTRFQKGTEKNAAP